MMQLDLDCIFIGDNMFKVGDKVKCINTGVYHITLNHTYIVEGIFEDSLIEINDNNACKKLIYASRFELVQESQPEVVKDTFNQAYDKHMEDIAKQCAQAYMANGDAIVKIDYKNHMTSSVGMFPRCFPPIETTVMVDTNGKLIVGTDYKQAFRDAVAYLDPGAIKRIKKLHPVCFEE